MSRYHQSSNPFEDEEEDNDFVKVDKVTSPVKPGVSYSTGSISSTNKSLSSASTAGYQHSQRSNPTLINSQSSSQYYEENSPFDDRREQLLMKIANSENTQIESTQRALASIYESESMGVATAEELLRQRETLNNIESKTDSMQQNMKISQRHLNNIKSVFGGIKNWWSGDKKATENKPDPESTDSKLRTTIEKTEKSRPDTSGFYDNDNDNDLDSKFMAGARKSGPARGQYTMIAPVTRSAREEEVDYNLSLMSDGMSRLKGLAMGLGEEIESQNEQLDRINVKVVRTDDLLTHQNTQMKRILKK